ncbi:MAG: hypothetical protein JWQ64_595, partial [Subtercola sp.]|nr:hypothetical protein [Subtercola sp.]
MPHAFDAVHITDTVHVIDVGGSHVTAALTRGGDVVARSQRDIDPHGSVDDVVGGWAAACL